MDDMKQIELIINSESESLLEEIEQSFNTLEVTRGKKARVIDPITVLAIAAGALKLVNELLDLREKLMNRADVPSITIRNLKGESIELSDATTEKLRNLLKES